ncbi:MAG: winged helix-turn-helix transcriptional regulator [SAR202 cluster bacterium]|nr:winged helix-turn-helix transcriptional regulator [SAR202 cluster bacterium]|tara:strand:+ start:72527 stop:72826 length:300 start_codon:yes stop_codon:yes gene_type:complete
MGLKPWTFITNHGLVLNYIYQYPSHTAREIASDVGITERAIHKIISDLETAGYVGRQKDGRKNIYYIDPELPLRHHSNKDISVSELLDALTSGNRDISS